MLACHNTRISLLRSSAALNKAVFAIARHGEVENAIAIVNRRVLEDNRPEMIKFIISGIHASNKGEMDVNLLSQIGRLEPEKDSETIRCIMEIYAIRGFHPSLSDSRQRWILPVIKAVVESGSIDDLVPLCIACMRRIKNEKKYIWKIYLKYSKEFDRDDLRVTSAMAVAACVNGWGPERVRMILGRTDAVMTEKSASMLIKALNHFPVSDPKDACLVDLALKKCGEVHLETSPELLNSVIEFYCVNRQFQKISQILENLNNQLMDQTIQLIFRHLVRAKDGALYFHFQDLFFRKFGYRKFSSMEIANACIDFAIASKSAKRLLRCLEFIHIGQGDSTQQVRVNLEVYRRTRIETLSESSQVPIRVRQKIRQFLKFI